MDIGEIGANFCNETSSVVIHFAVDVASFADEWLEHFFCAIEVESHGFVHAGAHFVDDVASWIGVASYVVNLVNVDCFDVGFFNSISENFSVEISNGIRGGTRHLGHFRGVGKDVENGVREVVRVSEETTVDAISENVGDALVVYGDDRKCCGEGFVVGQALSLGG